MEVDTSDPWPEDEDGDREVVEGKAVRFVGLDPRKAARELVTHRPTEPEVAGRDCVRIVMPSTPRCSTDYVAGTLESLAQELAGKGLCVDFTVYRVVSHQAGAAGEKSTKEEEKGMGEKEKEKEKVCVREMAVKVGPKAAPRTTVIQLPDTIVDLPPAADKTVITVQKRQQTLNFLETMIAWRDRCTTDWFLLMEDDFHACPGMAVHLQYTLRYAQARMGDATMRGFRISIGLNGLLLRCRDLNDMVARIALSDITRMPVDYLLGESWGKSSANIHTYRYNLLLHVGGTSTIGNTPSALYTYRQAHGPAPVCFELTSLHTTIPPHERFSVDQCCSLDIPFSPCREPLPAALGPAPTLNVPPAPKQLPDADIKWSVSPQVDTSCESHCNNVGLECREGFYPSLASVNTAVARVIEANVTECTKDTERAMPVVGVQREGFRRWCKIQSCPTAFSCKNIWPGFQRVCPCVDRKGKN